MALNPKKPRSRRLRSRTSLTAAADNLQQRLDRLGGQAPDVGEAWQRDVWELYDKVPELRTAARLAGEAMSQCRLVLARVSPTGEPIPLADDEDHPGKALLAGFAGGAGGQAELLDAIGVALTVPGETILVGALDPREALTDDFLRIQAYSSEQVRQVNQTVTIRRDESTRSDRTINLTKTVEGADGAEQEAASATAIRIWRPHPRFSWQADSAARAALGVLQEIAMYDDHILATGVSRLAGSGLLGIPEGMTLPGLAEEDLDPDAESDPFMQLLMEIMSLAIRDRKSAAALVPILLRGTPDDIAAMKHLTFQTPFDEKVAEYRDRAIGRLGSAVDMPSEILTGLGDTQGWIGSLITDDWKKSRLQTLMGLTVGSITTGWFYPALIATGNGTVASDVIVWYDDSSVRTRENTGPESQGAYDRGAIRSSSYRKALGYDDGDAIDWNDADQVKEAAAALLFKAPALAPMLMPLLGLAFTPDQIAATVALTEAMKGTGGAPGLGPTGTAEQAQTPPETGSAAVPAPREAPGTASGGPAMRAFRSVQGGS